MTDNAAAAAALNRAVMITDRLRSPGGCPWDAEQTHASLSRYLLEESYETLDAIASGDPAALREELGDLLYQVLFHARLAEEAGGPDAFSIAQVADDLSDKLIRRHPHVFADADATAGATEVEASWDAIKKAEKQRASVTEGIPLAQPSLSLATALLRRAQRGGVAATPPAGDDLGARLFALVGEAVAAGVDPELALRQTALDYADAVRAAEKSGLSTSGEA